jgi:single-strand DNA-binding protein
MQNLVIFEGNMTRDPEFKQLDRNCVCNFSLCCNNRVYQSDGTYKEYPTYMDCEAWGKLAQAITERYRKGHRVLVTDGTLKVDTWEDRDTGKRRTKAKIVVGWCTNLSAPFNRSERDSAGDGGGEAVPNAEPEDRVEFQKADIPF